MAVVAAAWGGAPVREGSGGWAGKLLEEVGRRFPGLFWAGRGRKDELDGELPAAATMAVAEGAQAGEGERERTGEDQWEEGELPGGAVAAAEGRRGNLHGAGPAAMAPAAR